MPRRVAISIEQKQALRAHRRAFPTFPNIELKRWFEAKYQQVISTSSVSEILSAKYTHLDNPINRTQSQKRFRQEFWPELEDALFQWIQPEDTTILDIEAGLQRLSFISAIENPMDIQHFLNPEEEIVTDSSESIDLQILAQFQAPDDEEEEEDPEVMPKVSSASALEAVQLLQLYQEQQEEA
ncbi:hypothetical protein AAEP93_009643 [Penicillium crustosum]